MNDPTPKLPSGSFAPLFSVATLAGSLARAAIEREQAVASFASYTNLDTGRVLIILKNESTAWSEPFDEVLEVFRDLVLRTGFSIDEIRELLANYGKHFHDLRNAAGYVQAAWAWKAYTDPIAHPIVLSPRPVWWRRSIWWWQARWVDARLWYWDRRDKKGTR